MESSTPNVVAIAIQDRNVALLLDLDNANIAIDYSLSIVRILIEDGLYWLLSQSRTSKDVAQFTTKLIQVVFKMVTFFFVFTNFFFRSAKT